MGSILDILLAILAVITVVLYAKRGFFLSLLRCFKWILAFGAAKLWGGALGAILGENLIYQPVRDSVGKKFTEIYANTANGFQVDNLSESLPQFLLNDEFKAKLAALGGSGTDLVNAAADTVAESITSVICAVLGFVLVFVLAFIGLSLIYKIVKGLKSKIKIIGIADTILGALLGTLLAFVFLFVISSAMSFFAGDAPIYTESAIAKFFAESALLENWEFLNINSWLAEIGLA